MTITYSLDHVASSVEDVSVEVAAKSEMTLQSTSTDPKTGETSSVYSLASGDNAYLAIVTYRNSVQNLNKGSVRKMSVTLSSWATATDDVANTVTKKPIFATAVYTVPADMTIETSDMDDLIGNLFSFHYLSVTSKVRDTTWLQKLLFGVPQVK